MSIPGELLIRLCRQGQHEILLVAPFIKWRTLQRLLDNIAPDVAVCCVTRWRPEEIAQGVSDLEVWNILRDRVGATLWVRNDLHAKYYRSDQCCLVGSANLTDTALGWNTRPNLELLIEIPANDHSLLAFEAQLLPTCLLVDEAFFNQMSEAVKLIEPHFSAISLRPEEHVESTQTLESSIASDLWWIPALRSPEDLYLLYAGQNDKLTMTSRTAAESDLRTFDIPPGLTREAFTLYLSLLLLQQPVVRQVDSFLITPQRFGAVRNLLSSLPCATRSDFDATYAWQTLIRWFLHFLPGRYVRIPSRHSEVFQRRIVSS